MCMQPWQHLPRLQQLLEGRAEVISLCGAVIGLSLPHLRRRRRRRRMRWNPWWRPRRGWRACLGCLPATPAPPPSPATWRSCALRSRPSLRPSQRPWQPRRGCWQMCPWEPCRLERPSPAWPLPPHRCTSAVLLLLCTARMMPELRTVKPLRQTHSCQPLCGLSGVHSCVAPIAYCVRPLNKLSRPHGLGGACRPRCSVSVLGSGLPRTPGSGSVACRRLGTQLCCA